MTKYNFASNLHKKGNIEAIDQMVEMSKRMEQKTNLGLAGAFLTKGYNNTYDVIAMLANKQEYEFEQGYIFYDNDIKQAIFYTDKQIEDMQL